MIIKDLRNKVERILEKYPESRNSDITLTTLIWKEFAPDSIKINQHGVEFVKIKDLFQLPREDNVKRIRATIQNEEHRYLPTSLKVAQQRKWNETEWRKLLGYNY